MATVNNASLRLQPPNCAVQRREQGAVTAEFAVALPAVVMVLAFVLVLSNIAMSAVTLQSAARSGARLAAVENNIQLVRTHVSQLAGAGSVVDVGTHQQWVTVTVRKPAPFGPFNLGTFELKSSATALRETEMGQW